jgi:hypothetical protein
MAGKYIDRNTGEIKYEPDFIKIYIRDICLIKGLNATQHKIFNFMLMNMNYENVVSYGPRTREKFLVENGLKAQTYNNNVGNLIKSNLIERIGRSEFRVNKKYAVKVDWDKVQSIEWKSVYSRDGVNEDIKININ